MNDSSRIVGVGGAAAQAADFSALPAIALRLGVDFDDPAPPRSLRLPGDGGIGLHALDWGGDGPRVLFLHGGRLTARTWDFVCLGLRRRIHAVALDLRGHGDSDWTDDDYAFERYVADVGGVLDALAWPRAHLVGMSLGGLAAGHFAAAQPHRVASLVLVDVGPGVVFEATARMRGFFDIADPGGGPDAMAQAAMQISSLRDPERVAYRMAAMMRRDDCGWRWAKDDRFAPHYPALIAAAEALAGAAERLPAPCLVVRGGRSQVFSGDAAARHAARFPDGKWVTVPDAGHNVQEDNPVGLVAALSAFWSRPAVGGA